MTKVIRSRSGQAMPDKVVKFGAEAFERSSSTVIHWLGNAGVFISSNGTNILIDPLLEGFDMPRLFAPPVSSSQIPRLDAVLVTHIDSDHYSKETCLNLQGVCSSYHSTMYVAEKMISDGLIGTGHVINSSFYVNDVKVTVTPVDHAWQNDYPEYAYRKWENDEYCGFRLDTPDCSVWMPGDSRLMDAHLHMPFDPDVILLDFSDDPWHISFEGAVKLANAYPNAKLICIHWGTVDAPELLPFNSDPTRLEEYVNYPERIIILRPGEPFTL